MKLVKLGTVTVDLDRVAWFSEAPEEKLKAVGPRRPGPPGVAGVRSVMAPTGETVVTLQLAGAPTPLTLTGDEARAFLGYVASSGGAPTPAAPAPPA